MEFILVLLWLGAAIVAGALFGRSVLGKLNRLAWERNQPLRFQLTDFFCLLMHLQFGMGLVIASAFSARNVSTASWILGVVSVTILFLWLVAIRTMSAAGVTETKRRAAFVLLLLPFSLLMISGVIVYVALLPMGVTWAVSQSELQQWEFYAFPLGGAMIGIAWYALRQLSSWILQGTSSGEDVAEEEKNEPPRRTH